jgi:hypothetical protein
MRNDIAFRGAMRLEFRALHDDVAAGEQKECEYAALHPT